MRVYLLLLTGLMAAQGVIVRRAARVNISEAPVPTSDTLYLIGQVIDAKSKEPLTGAYVKVLGTVVGAITDEKGGFQLPTVLRQPLEVEVSYVGYETKRLTLMPRAKGSAPEIIAMQEQEIVGQEVVIAASRTEEQFISSPVQIMSLSGLALRSSPVVFSAQTLGFLPGVDVIHTSLTFPVVNTRGFFHSQNGRFIQRADGVELLSVALSVPVYAFLAPPDIDVERMELIAGPASSLYGPNAFNGALIMTLKDPFQWPGLSLSVRTGINHIASERGSPGGLYEIQARYAHTWHNRLGLKLTLHGFRAQDWWARDTSDRGTYEGADVPFDQPGPNNPGYLPVNGYGYDARAFIPALPRADNTLAPRFYLSRTGYLENELLGTPPTSILKGSAELFYRFSDRVQGKVGYMLSSGQTFFQTHIRYYLNQFVYQLLKGEVTYPHGFVRAYAALENSGRSTALPILGANLLASVKPHEDWFVQYMVAYLGYLDALISPTDRAAFEAQYGRAVPQMGDHEAARWLADSDTRSLAGYPSIAFVPQFLGRSWQGQARPAPGSPVLRHLVDSLLQIPLTAGGARLVSRSAFYHMETQYELPSFAGIQTLIGGSARLYALNSEGTVFIDSGGRPLYNWEAGAYLQLRRLFWNERIQLTAGMRYDYRQYLTGQLTPRIALSLRADRYGHHILRAAYQTGFRNPVTDALFIRLNADIYMIGALPQVDRQFGIAGLNNYTVSSVQAYRAARAQGLSPEEAAKLLRSLPISGLRPEQLTSVEIGSRHLLLGQKLLIDLTYAYQRYRDLHGYVRLYGPADPQASLTPQDVENNNLSPVYGRYYNIPGEPEAHFFTIGTQYRPNRYLLLNLNYGYARAAKLEDALSIDPGLISYFNTPPHRVNAGITVYPFERWSASLQYQWVHAYLFEFNTFSRIVPTYSLLHMQVSYRIPKWYSEVRVGAQNLLNFYHIQVPGGPRIGGLYYLQYALDLMRL